MFYRKIKPLLWRELAFIQDRLFQIFFPISVNWSYKLAVDLQKDEVLPVSHLLISYNSNLPSGPLGPSQIGNFCEMLGIHKLNTTSYNPQCDGMVQLHIEVSSQETCSQVW